MMILNDRYVMVAAVVHNCCIPKSWKKKTKQRHDKRDDLFHRGFSGKLSFIHIENRKS
jgi:hypothetical protein